MGSARAWEASPSAKATGDIDGTAWLFALKETNGELVWKAKIGPGGEVGAIYTPAGPRGTPTVDGDRLYILSQHGELVCFTTEGKEVWRTDLVKDHGGLVPLWGYSESVLVDGQKLICTPGAKDGTLMALDKMTGKKIWKSTVPVPAKEIHGRFSSGRGYDSGARYASAIAIDFAGQRQYVQLTAKTLAGFSASD
jgi:outer membrane protein assembly factor BamB